MKNIGLLLFGLVVLVQWFVPGKMIFDQEKIIQTGTVYKFKTAPIDPADPFRGRYVSLNFEENRYHLRDSTEWNSDDVVFVLLEKDEKGFSTIRELVKERPGDHVDYIEATVDWVDRDSIPVVFINYPFSRFYMEETKAPAAENLVRDASIDSTAVTYALVSVKKGAAVITDVMINDQSLTVLAKDHGE